MYLDSAGNAIVDKSLYGHLAAGVPGSVDGMVKAHEKFGKLSWAEVVQPALDLARKGFPITDSQVEEFTELQEGIKNSIRVNHTLLRKSGQKVIIGFRRILLKHWS
jgi:gamma-glutamyltranspeptidase/glutathione hydrolase